MRTAALYASSKLDHGAATSQTCEAPAGQRKRRGIQYPTQMSGAGNPGRLRCLLYRQARQWRTVIRSFRHKGVQRFFETGSKSAIQASHVARLRLQLTRLDTARGPQDMNAPGSALHPLSGALAGHWAIRVNANGRLSLLSRDRTQCLWTLPRLSLRRFYEAHV